MERVKGFKKEGSLNKMDDEKRRCLTREWSQLTASNSRIKRVLARLVDTIAFRKREALNIQEEIVHEEAEVVYWADELHNSENRANLLAEQLNVIEDSS